MLHACAIVLVSMQLELLLPQNHDENPTTELIFVNEHMEELRECMHARSSYVAINVLVRSIIFILCRGRSKR
jgi:hypothetical protein